MRYTVVDAAEFTYPDRWDYATGGDRIVVEAPRGGKATFQILLEGLTADRKKENWLTREVYQSEALWEEAKLGFPRKGGVSVTCDLPLQIEWYSLVPVTVELNYFFENDGITEKDFLPHFPERRAPYRVYDCFRPFDGTLDVGVGDGRAQETSMGGLFGAVDVPKDAVPGEYSAVVTLAVDGEVLTVPMELKVYAAVIPEESLTIIQGHHPGTLAKYYGMTTDSPEFSEINEKYIRMLRRMRQNMMYTSGVKVTKVGENRYEFDFSKMEEAMRLGFSLGMKSFNGPSVGWRQSWEGSTILVNGNIPCMSYEGYCYLSQYLPALHAMLEKNGWLDRFVMGVADEPNDKNATEFRALCGLIRKFVPDIRLIDAMSYGDLHGALDIWVPLNAEYDKHQEEMETLRGNGDEIWHYVCCGPRDTKYINRFLDQALLATRYLFWGNYRHDLTGYLHWASACYQGGQDPFRQNCPVHFNTDHSHPLPAGDTHILYPGEDGPWLSARSEAQRESAEEYEMLKALAKRDKARADSICAKVFRSFCDVEYDVAKFRAARRELLEALSE